MIVRPFSISCYCFYCPDDLNDLNVLNYLNVDTYNNFFVSACREGHYGLNCSRVCLSNCKSCKPTDGTCSCSAGWMGANCSIGNWFCTIQEYLTTLE